MDSLNFSNSKKVNDRSFFQRDALTLSRELLGKIIARRIDNKVFRYRIVETEAYLGLKDKASHTHPTNRKRNSARAMYSDGGFIYVYLIYGIYHCLNIVASNHGDPQAVLIRALEPLFDTSSKPKCTGNVCPTNGPGKLCRYLKLNIAFNDIDLLESDAVWLETNEGDNNFEIVDSKRINIGYAGEDTENLWRFYIKGSSCVSKIDKQREFLMNN